MAKKEEQKPRWYVIDASGKVVGKVAVTAANVLRGKVKPQFTPHVDTGDFVVVVNASKAVFTGKKETDKQYMTYSQYPGKETVLAAATPRQASRSHHRTRRQRHDPAQPARPRDDHQTQSLRRRRASARRAETRSARRLGILPEKHMAKASAQAVQYLATGRRKTSVARAKLTPGSGKLTINERELNDYLGVPNLRMMATFPLTATETTNKFDAAISVDGGGPSGQAGAIRHALARALLKAQPDLKAVLRDKGLLTRDSRMRERKKYGQPGARKRFQFSKR